MKLPRILASIFLMLVLLCSFAFAQKGYYINSKGKRVHRPVKTTGTRIPAGATAQCGDGSYSFSQSRRGTCSHHGGVSRWL